MARQTQPDHPESGLACLRVCEPVLSMACRRRHLRLPVLSPARGTGGSRLTLITHKFTWIAGVCEESGRPTFCSALIQVLCCWLCHALDLLSTLR